MNLNGNNSEVNSLTHINTDAILVQSPNIPGLDVITFFRAIISQLVQPSNPLSILLQIWITVF